MNVVSSLSDAAAALAGGACVLSVGNFDGLHRGHQAILQTVVRRARALGLPAVAMTFEPHPIQVLAPGRAPMRISTPEQKQGLIAGTGIDLLFTVRFDLAFAKIPPDDFLRQYLVDGLHVRTICVGNNFNFGYRQGGTVETLRQWSSEFETVEVPPVLVRNLPASSTEVRKAVESGNVSSASRLLGRWLEIEGTIVSDAGRGRKVTVPTLNLDPANELLPGRGVYATRISLDGGEFMDAVTNIGVRPTFGEQPLTIETFVLHGAIASQVNASRLQFMHRIRDEKRFDSAGQLAGQIARDVRSAAKFFRLLGNIEHVRTTPCSR